MVTNISSLNNLTGMSDVALFTNDATGGVLITGGLIALFVVFIVVLLRNDKYSIQAVFAAGGWSFFVVSIFFFVAHLVPIAVPLGFLVVAAIGTFLLFTASRY